MQTHFYRSYNSLPHIKFRQQLLHISNTTPLALIPLLSQTCKPFTDQEYYRYYFLIQHYTNALYEKIQSTENIKQSLTLLKLWYQELIYNTLRDIPLFPKENYIIDKILDQTLDKMFTRARLDNQYINQLKHNIYTKFIKKLHSTNIRQEIKIRFNNTAKNMHSITNHTINTMKTIGAVIQNDNISLLLAFHGVIKKSIYITQYPNTPISTELKKIYRDIMQAEPINTQSVLKLFATQHIVHTIYDKIKTTSIKVNIEYNQVYKFTLYQYPWYSIINRIKQIIITLTVIPRLQQELTTLKHLRSTFTKSIAYGDTVFFFEQLPDIKNTITLFKKRTSTIKLISELKKMETSADNKIITTQDFITHMKQYAMRPSNNTTTQQFPSELHTYIPNNHIFKKPNILSKTKKIIRKNKYFFKKTTKSLTNQMKKLVQHNRQKHQAVSAYLTSTEATPGSSTQILFNPNNIS
ncbi:hypothetical protein EDL79_04325 [Ehrlichia ruminantium]|uniref:Uncharacterized protein n=1 Tax=Ehrlichia ruminantium TaxID=779 RepID=A0AAE6QBJ3_EHRRU|nr:hypothetical protein [Ehrlichia ruminantium]QGR02834.1 hypothetical protein EDL81_04305 [Ehrlichia ruminantium]QGR03758.1 hypothetical protein EDL80_04315 [Ehrlichia ruminantium]QGR04685.1 hypothetical protein EDL79_04325 [Ehrlichia ruminantium]